MARSVSFTIGLALVFLVVASSPAYAGVLWDNGTAISNSGRCDSTPVCNGSPWTVYDNFTLGSASTVTGLTYNDYFHTVAPYNGTTYDGTNWTIWNSDPFTASGPVASGTSVGLEGPVGGDAAGSTLFTVTGLDVSLDAGTYWLGIQNIVGADTQTTRALSATTGTFKQSSPLPPGTHEFNVIGETAFTVEGAAVPEPGTLSLLGCALIGLGIGFRRKRG